LVGQPFIIKLLGGLELRRHDGVPVALTSRVARSVLAYLIVHRDRAHTREHLVGVFWPDEPETQARRKLSQALWKIGAALGQDVLMADSLAVRFSPDVAVQLDLDAFESVFTRGSPEAADQQAVQAALNAYRGEFMAGYSNDWVLDTREQFREALLTGLERLARRAEARGDLEQALEFSRRVVGLEPLREQAHREVMRLCLILNRPREALEQFERCRKVLLEELGEEPLPATRALYQRIQLGESSGTSESVELERSIPLVGRETERAVLLEHLEQARRRRGGMVLLEAEAGLGKTRLLTEIAQDATWRGFEVRFGRGQEWGVLEPYAAIREVLETDLTPLRLELLSEHVDALWLREAARIVRAFERPGTSLTASLPPEQERSRLREAITRIVLALAGIVPQLIVLDDLQWLDDASLEWLAPLMRALRGAPLMIVLGYRPGEARERPAVWQALEALDREGGRRIKLEALSGPEVAQLVRRALGTSVETPLERRLQLESQGNPLFVLETLQVLIEQGGLRQASLSDQSELPLPGSVREVIVSRLTRLDPRTRVALDAAAVIGTGFGSELCGAVSGLSRAATLEALDALIRRGFLMQSDAGIGFSHDRLRQIVYAELLEADRRALHAATARALEGLGSNDPALLALHFDEGGVRDRALEFHRRAAERAVGVYAYSAALEHLDRAVMLTDQVGLPVDARFALLESRVEVLGVLGRREEQFRDLETMMQLSNNDPVRLTGVKCRQARLLTSVGDLDQGRVLAEETLEEARTHGDRSLQAEALSVLAVIAMRSGRREEAIPIRQEIVEIHHGLGDVRREAKARRNLGNSLMVLQQLDEAYRQIRVALDLIRNRNDRVEIASLVSSLGHIWRFRGKYLRAAACYRFDLSLARSIGHRSSEASSLINLAQALEHLGRMVEAMQCYTQAIEVFQAINDPEGEASARYNLAGLLVEWTGDFQAVSAHLEAAQAFYRRVSDSNGLAYCLVNQAGMALQQADLQQAQAILNSEVLHTQGQRNRWLGVQHEVMLAQLEIELGRSDQALTRLERIEGVCRSIGLNALIPRIITVRADALLESGQPQVALGLIEELLGSPDADTDFELHFRHFRVLDALGQPDPAQADVQPDPAQAALDRAYQALLLALADLSTDQRAMSLSNVRKHREIVLAWESRNLRRETVRLPRAGTPTGRALRDDEYVDVTWTRFAPEDNTVQDKTERRQYRLARLVDQARDQGATPTVDDLARALDSSRATIKRDLAALRQAGSRVQTRGSRGVGNDADESHLAGSTGVSVQASVENRPSKTAVAWKR
jgi:DNA-binding SARP family transcriptional activator/predicted ATPase/biotin operon repressor